MFKTIFFLSVVCLPLFCSPQSLDDQLINQWNVHRNKKLDGTFKVITNSAGPVVFGAPVLMLATGLLDRHSKLLNNGLEVTASTIINGVLTVGLKRIIQRDRPTADPVLSERSYSFPSGHTSSTFAMATTLSLQYPKWYVIVPSYVFATLVGYSRIHLGVHYPSDVIGGMIVGAGSAVLTKWARKKLETKKKSPSKIVLLH